MKKFIYMTIFVLYISFSFPACAAGFPNPYEQTYDTFTNMYCLPAQWLNQQPEVDDYKADPNGITWCIFAFEDDIIQLTGKNSIGEWKIAKWCDVDSTTMLFICYCLCGGFGSSYEENKDFCICLYSSSGNHDYIGNKESAEMYIAAIDEWMIQENIVIPEPTVTPDARLR